MMEERIVLGDGLRVEVRVAGDQYRMACIGDDGPLIEYTGTGGRHRRRERGRLTDYEFKSVEQLRYDFERDVADLASAR